MVYGWRETEGTGSPKHHFAHSPPPSPTGVFFLFSSSIIRKATFFGGTEFKYFYTLKPQRIDVALQSS